MTKWKRRAVAIVSSLLAVTLLGSVLAPSLCRAREPANRVKCASNLKQIGQAMLLYSESRADALPDSFATLLATEDLVPEVFTCPSSNAEKADPPASFRDEDEKHCSYRYLGDGLTMSRAGRDVVLATERLDDHDNDGVNLLFGDGTVEWFAYSRKNPGPWFTDLQQQIDAGARPVRVKGR